MTRFEVDESHFGLTTTGTPTCRPCRPCSAPPFDVHGRSHSLTALKPHQKVAVTDPQAAFGQPDRLRPPALADHAPQGGHPDVRCRSGSMIARAGDRFRTTSPHRDGAPSLPVLLLFGIYAASIVADDNRCCSRPAQGQFVVTRRLVVRCDRSHPRGESPRGAGLNVGDGFATPCRRVIASQALPKRVFGKQNDNQVIDFSMLRFRVRDLTWNSHRLASRSNAGFATVNR